MWGTFQFISWEAFQAWVLPALSVPATVMIGSWSSIPWFYIYLGALFAFAMTATGLLRFSEWRFRVTAKDKLSFSNVRVRKRLSEQGVVSGVQIGCELKNEALFPMEFVIQSAQTRIFDLYPPKRDYEKDDTTIPANGFGWFDDHEIPLDSIQPHGLIAEALISLRLKYGRPKKTNHELTINKKIFIKFTSQGDIEFFNWQDT